MAAWNCQGRMSSYPVTTQGLCEARELEDFDRAKYWMCLMNRRSCLHPGPRYKARGLNDYAEPGNELEVEQVGREGECD